MFKKQSSWKGAIAGGIGGALGTLALNVFQKASLEATRKVEDSTSSKHEYSRQQEQLISMFEDAHVATAEALGFRVRHSDRGKTALKVEFAFGVLCGAVYGALAEHRPTAKAGFGGVYGAVLFTGASEVVLPAIGFVPSPADRTPVQHIGGLAGNVVYGLVTESVRRLSRGA